MGVVTRRHGETLSDAIRAAVLTELDARGYGGLTFEGVAATARTGKAVLYRRWPTKALMVLDALDVTEPNEPAPDTGSLAGDLHALLMGTSEQISERRRATILGLLADLDGGAAQLARAKLFHSATQLLRPVLERARERGELGAHDVPHRALAMPFDLLRHDALLHGRPSKHDVDAIVTHCVVPLYVALTTVGSVD